MKTIAFIIPYFGPLPNYFPIWLRSCAQNPTVDFLLFTDQQVREALPENVSVISMRFAEVKALFQAQFEFPIGLATPYKLCDYKPVYGAAFQEWIKDYDFWGHCDIDLIWGNIRAFMTDELLDSYDRILNQGHCSLYKNNEKVNRYYRTLDPMGCMDWHDVYSSEKHFSFDEYAEHNGGGLSLIMEKNGVPIYAEWPFANIDSGKDWFQLSLTEDKYYSTESDAKAQFFERNEKGLYLWYRKNNVIQKKEFMYVHFLRRKVSGIKQAVKSRSYLLVPPGLFLPEGGSLQEKECARIMQVNHTRLKNYRLKQNSRVLNLTSRVIKKAKKTIGLK